MGQERSSVRGFVSLGEGPLELRFRPAGAYGVDVPGDAALRET